MSHRNPGDWITKLGIDPIPWLMEGEPWTRLFTLGELMDRKEDDPDLLAAREDLNSHPNIIELKQRALDWFTRNYTRHNDPKLPHYYLSALADLGIKADDPGMERIVEKVRAHREGSLYAIRQSLPVKGQKDPDPDDEQWHSLPCDAPVITSALLQMGYHDKQVLDSLDEILLKWNGQDPWFCHFFFVEGIFKKTGADCPMAGLLALQSLTFVKDRASKEWSHAVNKAYASLCAHRESGKSLYYFGRSKKFWTLKFPFVWYNALYMAHVLSYYPQFHTEPLYQELLKWIIDSQEQPGRWKANSVFMPYKGWDFGQKREPSRWISARCCAILRRSFET